MKVYFNNFFHDIDLSPFIQLFQNVFNTNIETGTVNNSDILFESVFGNATMLYSKKWLYSFLFIGESDRRLSIFINNGMQNPIIKDYSCVLKGKSENDNLNKNVINFPLFLLYSYSFDFIYKLKKHNYHDNRFNVITKSNTNIPKKNVCVIISNAYDSEGRNVFIEELNKKVEIDYAGNYKNNVKRVEDMACSPGFIEFVSQYKIIITMENSKNNNYITEKILEGFAAKTIPVYWGADNVGDYFNKDRFINVKSFTINDINKAIDQIMMILNNDELFNEIINKPIYVNNYIPLTLNNISTSIKHLLHIENKQHKTFITFGGPTCNFHNNVNRICEEAKYMDVFDEITGFTECDLQNDKLFWEKHNEFIENNKRGYGYWIWKSYLIKKKISELNENDILIFCDAGCEININGKQRLLEYIDMLNYNKENYGIITFQLEYKEYQFTKKSVFDTLQFNDTNVFQNISGIIIIKKNNHSINIINEWYKYCENYNLINDIIQVEDSNFIENRHDQSILSVLSNKYGSIKILDETYFSQNWEIDGFHYPFWAKRLK